MKNFFLLTLSIFYLLTTQAQNDSIYNSLDKAAFLLGMIEYPRAKAEIEKIDTILSTYLFKEKNTADLFLKTAKDLGIKKLSSGKYKNHYFVKSKLLTDSLNSYLIFVKTKKFENPYSKFLNLKLRKYDSLVIENFKDKPTDFLAALSLEGYPNPYLFNEKQQISFLLGFIASNATFKSDTEPGSIKGNYTIRLYSYETYYLVYIKVIMERNKFEIMQFSSASHIDSGYECFDVTYHFNAPEVYRKYILQLTQSREEKE